MKIHKNAKSAQFKLKKYKLFPYDTNYVYENSQLTAEQIILCKYSMLHIPVILNIYMYF